MPIFGRFHGIVMFLRPATRLVDSDFYLPDGPGIQISGLCEPKTVFQDDHISQSEIY